MNLMLARKHGLGIRILVCLVLAVVLLFALPHVAAAATTPNTTRCDLSWTHLSSLFDYACWGRLVGSLIGGSIVYIASWVLTLSGVLFNWVLNVTVVQFGQFMTDTVIQAITSAWTAFRDVANIVIIGMFTFIAISIILGIKEFGQKRLIAHVLIIAVLINFSLLFTKMAIDASNFVATQFYNAGLSQVAGGSANSTNITGIGNCPQGTSASQCYGIAGAFMDYAGVSSFADTGQAVGNLADQLDDGIYALVFALFTAGLFFGAAIVLFYGSFLLVSRAILFIFLMSISALAFASYLVPVWDKSNYGFNAWKSALLKNALLAPLMILFLWMTLNIAAAMKAGAGGGTLGDLIANPTKDLNINALFGYVVVLGLLFVSFKLSSSLASKIGGFGFASLAPALGIAAGSRVAGLLGRYSLGLGAGAGARALERTAKGAERAGYTRVAKGLLGSAQPFDKLAKRDFNLMNTSLGKNISGIAGLKGSKWSGESKIGGIEGTQKALAEQYAKQAEKLTTSAADADKIRKDAATSVEGRQQFKEQRNLLKGIKQTSEQNLAAVERTATENKAPLKDEHDKAKSELEVLTRAVEDNKKSIHENFDREIKSMTDQLAKTTNAEESTLISNKMRGLEKERDAQLRTEESRIQAAHATVNQLQSRIQAEDDKVETARGYHKSQLDMIEKEEAGIKTKAAEIADQELARKYPNLNKKTEDIAASVANKRATKLFGVFESGDDHLASLARKKTKESAEDKRLKGLFNKFSESSTGTKPAEGGH